MKTQILFACVIFSLNCYAQTPIKYVNKSATGANNGSSWANAYTTLQSGMDNQVSSGQVWVAAGDYSPSGYSFVMRKGVEVYGGFAGTETDLSQRDWKVNTTIMRGDGNHSVIDNRFNSSYYMDGSAVLDGFTITGGHAGGHSSTSYPEGGGIHNNNASPTLRNLIITGNVAEAEGGGIYGSGCSSKLSNVTVTGNSAYEGGGIYFEYGSFQNSTVFYPTLTDVLISLNTSDADGGGLYLYSSSPVCSRIIIRNNESQADQGGGIYVRGSGGSESFTMENSLIANNEAGAAGGIYIEGGQTKLTNVTVTRNRANNAAIGGIFLDWGANLQISNSIVFGNIGISSAPSSYNRDLADDNGSYDMDNCVVSGFGTDPNNFEVDPEFLDADNGDFHLTPTSPLLNLGNNTFYTSSSLVDLDGNPRIFNNTIDIGAFEFQGYLSIQNQKTDTPLLHPNPAGRFVTVQFGEAQENVHVTLADINGHVVLELDALHATQKKIDLSSFAEGVYLVNINTGTEHTVSKLIICR